MELRAGRFRHAVHRPDRRRVGAAPLPGSTSTPANEPWSAGCQSARGDTRSKRSRSSLIGPAIRSPSATGSAPPGVKSFWKSTIRRASMDGMVGTSRPCVRVGPRMDFLRSQARIVGTPWQERAARNVAGCAQPRPDRPRTSRPSSATTGPAPTAPPTSSCTMQPRPRTSLRRHFSRRFAHSTASTADGPSDPGCTGSS